VLFDINVAYKNISLDYEALQELPSSGTLPGTYVETNITSVNEVQLDITDGPGLSRMSSENDFVRPSVLTLGSDARSNMERLAAASGSEANQVHMKLGKRVDLWKKNRWRVRYHLLKLNHNLVAVLSFITLILDFLLTKLVHCIKPGCVSWTVSFRPRRSQ
jgi:hypothetical protein